MHKILLISFALINTIAVFAQNKENSLYSIKPTNASPPIPAEVFVRNKNLMFQMTVSKHFSPKSRLGFFNVTNFVGDYQSTNQNNQFMSQSWITADIWKGISLNTGVVINYMTGFRPTVGLQYVFANPNFFIVALPRFDLTQTYSIETFGLVEYKSKFNTNWGLYTRFQGLYNRNTKPDSHDRSYIWLRAGASYKNFQFGIGNNFDFYGPKKLYENSFGVFVRTELF